MSLSDQPALLINAFNNRFSYINNKLFAQARNGLQRNMFELLVRCWQHDFKVNKLRKNLQLKQLADSPFNSYLSHAGILIFKIFFFDICKC